MEHSCLFRISDFVLRIFRFLLCFFIFDPYNAAMNFVGTASSKIPIPEQAARTAARQALEKAGITRADTVLFFLTSDYKKHYEKIAAEIKTVTGAKNIVGASAGGVLTDQEEIEKQAGLCVMAMNTPDIDTHSFLIPNLQESSFRAGEKTAQHLRETQTSANLMLLFPDPFSFKSTHFFEGFEQNYEYVPMTGAAAGENGKEEKTYQFENGKVFFDAVAGVSFGGNFRSEIGITRSCQPFGEALKVTRAEGNMIYEIEGRPAYDILLESLSAIEFENPDQLFQRVFLGMPTRSFQTDFNQNFLIRNIMGINTKKGMLSTVSPVEEGEFLTFTVRDPKLARADLQRMLSDMKGRFDDQPPGFGFYFNCCARGQQLYSEPNHDINLIRETFPQVPIIGFSGYGELAPLDHVNHLHQHCGVLTLIS